MGQVRNRNSQEFKIKYFYLHTKYFWQVRTRNSQEYKINLTLEEGDVLGFTYDHVELNVYCNGKNLDTPVLGIKGTVFPVFYVDEGAILDCIFEEFQQPVPNGFEKIMIEKALL